MKEFNFYKHIQQDASVFIDAANLFYIQKSLKIEIDFKKLYIFLKSYKRMKDIFIYLAHNETKEKELKFIEFLKNIGYKVIYKKLKVIKGKDGVFVNKGNLDIELALDSYELKDTYRTFVLFSGDSDFEVLVRKLKKHSKRCVFVSTKGHASTELFETCHSFIDLRKMIEYIKKEPPR